MGGASMLVYEAGESQLIPAMRTVEHAFKGSRLHPAVDGRRRLRIHVELGVRGDPAQVGRGNGNPPPRSPQRWFHPQIEKASVAEAFPSFLLLAGRRLRGGLFRFALDRV